MISFYKHNLDKNKNYLKKTISGAYLTSGPICAKVEMMLQTRFKKKYALLTNSWTNGLIAILLALKLKKTDEVIIPACTFVACANVIEMVGARVIFADIDPLTKLMDLNDCVKKITKNTKVIMPVHLYGNLFNTKELKKKINKKIIIIEDSAHAFCGNYNNKVLGTYADFAVFSFYATKSITCGEGGAIITNHEKYANLIRSISNNGMTKPAFKRFVNNKYIPWDVHSYGFKANLSDINASILIDQINQYSIISRKKTKIFRMYKNNLKGIKNLNFPKNNKNSNRDFYLFPIGVNQKLRNNLIEYLLKKKIFVTVNFKSITELSFYKKKYKVGNCKNAEIWGKQQLSLPFHAKMTFKEVKKVSSEIKHFFSASNI